MKTPNFPQNSRRGASLIEAIVAVGVLAVAIPLVFGTLAESGKSGVSSQVETRSSWIIPACFEEIQASRDGRARYFTNTTAGQAFPEAGGIWALAFSLEGKALGKVSASDYEKGIKKTDTGTARYLASMSAEAAPVNKENPDAPPMMMLKISLEYPAIAPMEKRQKVEFYSRIP